MNAHWSSNGMGGTDHMCYALCDLTNTAQPLGRAVDPWVHWHEMGGHGTLGDHVGGGTSDSPTAPATVSPRCRWTPSQRCARCRSGSAMRHSAALTTERRFDRLGLAWAWGSANDDGNYGAEQILATCHFRIYRSIGGDHGDLGRRRFASRVMTYLILRAIGDLTPRRTRATGTRRRGPTCPAAARELWCEAPAGDTDDKNWDSEGLSGRRLQQGNPVGIREAGAPTAAIRPPSTSTSTTAAAASTRSSPSTGTTSRCGTATRRRDAGPPERRSTGRPTTSTSRSRTAARRRQAT